MKRLDLPTESRKSWRMALVFAVLAAYVLVFFVVGRRYRARELLGAARWEVRGGDFYRDGVKYLVKGVGWDPTRPGQVPWRRVDDMARIDADLARVRAAGFNTIRTWEFMSPEELAAAKRRGLAVLMGVWVDRDGPYRDPKFRAKELDKVARAVRASRASGAVMAYLVMNEPDAGHVLREGVGTTRAFLRELAAAVRREDPRALVGFSSWPGLEFADEPSLDFVATNLHPFRPQAVLKTVGYSGMVRLWKDKVARGRPLIVSEYGISVSTTPPKLEGPGGATEAEQAERLPELADAISRAGADGGALFQWLDCWWKNKRDKPEALVHDAGDGEEWFGLYAFDHDPHDPVGRPRPALAAMRRFNRAVLTAPLDGRVPQGALQAEAYVEGDGPVAMTVAADGSAPLVAPGVRDGPWVRARFRLPPGGPGPRRLEFALFGPDGAELGRFSRVVIPAGQAPTLVLKIESEDSWRRAVALLRDGAGRPMAGRELRFATTDADGRTSRLLRARTDRGGRARMQLDAPRALAVTVVAAYAPRDADPPLAYDAAIIAPEPAP